MKNKSDKTSKRTAIKLYLKEHWEASSRSVGRATGSHHSTVESVRSELIASGYNRHLSSDKPDEKWREHPYLKANPHLLETLNPRGLRAVKRVEVLDYLMANKNVKSPCVAQAKLARENILKRKNASVSLSEKDIVIKKANVCNLNELSFVPDSGVDLAICDPPFGRTSAKVCRGIAQAAGAKLREGGSLLVLTGSSHLPEVIEALSSADKTGLKYHWLLACPLPQGAAASTSWLRVQSKVRIVLWYVKGTYTGDIVSDYIDRPSTTSTTDKILHPWAAPGDLVSSLITRFSDPGDLVADWTVGSGTTPYCCAVLGRRFVGVDSDGDAVKTAQLRVRQAFGFTK